MEMLSSNSVQLPVRVSNLLIKLPSYAQTVPPLVLPVTTQTFVSPAFPMLLTLTSQPSAMLIASLHFSITLEEIATRNALMAAILTTLMSIVRYATLHARLVSVVPPTAPLATPPIFIILLVYQNAPQITIQPTKLARFVRKIFQLVTNHSLLAPLQPP